ncbi:MAG: hypothetical protein WDN50_05055 [Bradyrhizobium sp.]
MKMSRSQRAYFSSLKPKSVIKVIEADTIPKTQVARVFYALVKDGGTEPIGERIVETPVNAEQFEHRDSRSQFIVYVRRAASPRAKRSPKPEVPGSQRLARPAMVRSCEVRRPVPGIAGRSPSYLVRQIYDFQQHARAGSGAAQMVPVVEKLSPDDMISLAAYVASLQP